MTDEQKARAKVTRAAYVERNKELLLAKAREYYWANLEKCKEKSAKYHEENPERVRQKRVEVRARDPEETKRRDKAKRDLYSEKRKEQFAKWYEENAEYCRARARAHRANNLEQAKKSFSNWYQKNRARQIQRSQAYWLANIETIKARVSAHRKANPEISRMHCQNRRARRLDVGGSLSAGLSGRLFALQKGKCPCCNLPLGSDYQMDHIVPLALGGPNIDSNIQLMRQRCNSQKRAKHPVDFMQSRGFLL